MIDIKRIVSDKAGVERALRKRVASIDLSEVIEWHTQRSALKTSIDAKNAQRKALSAKIGQMLARKEGVESVKSEVNALNKAIQEEEASYTELDERVQHFLARLPNVPEEEVPAGGKEQNQPLEYHGQQPSFDFPLKDHVALATSLALVDYERGAKLGGSGKWVYSGDGARLEWALLNYCIAHHLEAGRRFVLPPHLLRLESGFVAGQFPKFEADVFHVGSRKEETDGRTHFLVPTAETALANLYADEVIPADDLPIELFSYTPCYRREAGTYRANERGTIRGNQFNKVEMFTLAKPEDSEAQFRRILSSAKSLMDGLGLHYRVTRLAAEDCSEAMAKTYDLEVWLPSIGEYKEVSSVSTSHTFQAIRGSIRFKERSGGKTQHVHTLNGSGLATSRLFPAILEQLQTSDGRVKIPAPLRSALGKDFLEPSGGSASS